MTERNTSTNLKKVSNNITNRSLCNNVSSQSYAKAYMLNDDGILVSDEAEESDQNTEDYNSKQILTVVNGDDIISVADEILENCITTFIGIFEEDKSFFWIRNVGVKEEKCIFGKVAINIFHNLRPEEQHYDKFNIEHCEEDLILPNTDNLFVDIEDKVNGFFSEEHFSNVSSNSDETLKSIRHVGIGCSFLNTEVTAEKVEGLEYHYFQVYTTKWTP
ncbi:hypothetical protein FQA39_LY15671 [Lamprigera yunnana]|nr:hypothetical protein FQA39_LY15671 [Lamprigera yunnana]